MKKTITIAAYRRPEYLKQVLDSLAVAMSHAAKPGHILMDDVILGIDPCIHSSEHHAVRCIANSYDWIDDVIVWPEHLGVNEHPRRLLQYAFNECGSDFNLHLEDDTVLSPDALRLVEWFANFGIIDARENVPPRHAFAIGSRVGPYDLSLSLHNPSRDYEHRSRLYHTDSFGVWGWACHAYSWRNYLMPFWNHKRDLPIGWDWSISATMSRIGLRCIAPSLSRVHNIGRERGHYQTPEGYDKDFAGQVWAGEEHMQRIEDFHFE